MKKQSLREKLLWKWYDIEWWFSDLNPLEWSMLTFVVAMGIILLTVIF